MKKEYFQPQTQTEEWHIDYAFLARKVWEKKVFILLFSLLSAVSMFGFSRFVLQPQYRSTTKLYIVSQKDASAVTAQDLQLGNLLIQDYKEIMLSGTVVEAVAREFKMDPKEIYAKISISSPRDNRILSISVQDTDPQRAANIANSLREKSIYTIKRITKIKDISTIDEAKVAEKPFAPSIKKNTFLAFILGFFFATAFFVAKEIINDRITSPEDVENLLGETLLGVIPRTGNKKKKRGK